MCGSVKKGAQRKCWEEHNERQDVFKRPVQFQARVYTAHNWFELLGETLQVKTGKNIHVKMPI